jgi:hypothetical protein
MSKKNSNYTIGKRTRDLPACSGTPYLLLPLAGSLNNPHLQCDRMWRHTQTFHIRHRCDNGQWSLYALSAGQLSNGGENQPTWHYRTAYGRLLTRTDIPSSVIKSLALLFGIRRAPVNNSRPPTPDRLRRSISSPVSVCLSVRVNSEVC